MRTLRLIGMTIAFITICFGLSSCNDDDKEENYPSELIGKWLYDTEAHKELLTFKNDGSLVSSGEEDGEPWKDITGSFTCDGNNISLIFIDGDNSHGTYKVTSTTLTLTIDGEDFVYTKKSDNYTFGE